MAHELFEHEHFECTALGELHIHEVELDCEFQKFNLSNYTYLELVKIPAYIIVPKMQQCFSQYTFLSKYQQLHFALRGPPMTS